MTVDGGTGHAVWYHDRSNASHSVEGITPATPQQFDLAMDDDTQSRYPKPATQLQSGPLVARHDPKSPLELHALKPLNAYRSKMLAKSGLEQNRAGGEPCSRQPAPAVLRSKRW